LKPLNILEKLLGMLSVQFFPVSRFNQLIARAINLLEINAYTILETLFLSRILKHVFKQGRRSYILAEK